MQQLKNAARLHKLNSCLAQKFKHFNHDRHLETSQSFKQNVQLLSWRGSITVQYNADVGVAFETYSSLSDNAILRLKREYWVVGGCSLDRTRSAPILAACRGLL